MIAYSPNVDAIQEFRLITTNPPAEYGNSMGAIVNTSISAEMFWLKCVRGWLVASPNQVLALSFAQELERRTVKLVRSGFQRLADLSSEIVCSSSPTTRAGTAPWAPPAAYSRSSLRPGAAAICPA